MLPRTYTLPNCDTMVSGCQLLTVLENYFENDISKNMYVDIILEYSNAVKIMTC